jgi:hypothetical protein
VPYNFKVTSATKIQIDGNKAGFDDLDIMTCANIIVTFVPMRKAISPRKFRSSGSRHRLPKRKEKPYEDPTCNQLT